MMSSISRVGSSGSWMPVCLAVAVTCTGWLGGCRSRELKVEPGQLVQVEKLSLPVREAYGRLIGPNQSLSDREFAATTLLNLQSAGNEEAGRALRSALSPSQRQEAWQGVLQAVIKRPKPPSMDLAPPLLALLGQAEGQTRLELGAALRRFDDPRVVQQLVSIAANKRLPPAARAEAATMLGYTRTRPIAATLVGLLEQDEPALVQSAAHEALTYLSGRDDIEASRYAWGRWLEGVVRLDEAQWQQALLENVTRRQATRGVSTTQLEDRLVRSVRNDYLTAAESDRPAVLVDMLNESIPSIRALGVELAAERLLSGGEFDGPLRSALRDRLGDPEPAVRRQVTLLLRDLGDRAAAEEVAQSLAETRESVPGVLQAQLRLMERMPRREAVEAAYLLLSDATVRGDAAAALTAMADADLLERKDRDRALSRLRANLRRLQPTPAEVLLMGRVGEKEDWERIGAWLGDPNPAIRQAAAEAWAASGRSLEPLARRSNDAAVQPTLLAAAAARGDDAATMRLLAANKPERRQAVEAWRGALTAMAGRVEPVEVLRTVAELEAAGEGEDLREAMLTAAVETRSRAGRLDAGAIDPLMARAKLRLDTGNPTLAIIDYERLGPYAAGLSASQRERYERGRIDAYLTVNQVEEAFVAARSLLGTKGAGASRDPVLDLFLDKARERARAGRDDEAASILTNLRRLLGPRMEPEIAQRIALLEARLERVPGTAVTEAGQ